MDVLRETYLECTSAGHNKFYRIQTILTPIGDFQVITTYGPIGKAGRDSIKNFGKSSRGSNQAASYHADTKHKKEHPSSSKSAYTEVYDHVPNSKPAVTPQVNEPEVQIQNMDWSKIGPTVTWG